MKFLRFNSESTARTAFAEYLTEDNQWPAYIGSAAVDVVGVVYRPTGEVQQSEDGEMPVLAPIPGWHINLSERVPALQQYEIEPPSTPDRVFAGSDSHVNPVWPRFVGNAKLDLFTRQEQMAVVTATMADPMVKLMYDRLLGAAYLGYEDPETEQGLALLVDKGLLTPERKAEIVQQMQPH